MPIDYKEITGDILSPLKPRTIEIVERRFGLGTGRGETLQSIGDSHSITRERVRQIEKAGLDEIRPRLGKHQGVIDFFRNQLEVAGGVRRESTYLSLLGPRSYRYHILFLLNLQEELERIRETESTHALWTKDRSLTDRAQELADIVAEILSEKNKPATEQEIQEMVKEEANVLFGLLSASKKVRKGPRDLWGLSHWPEVNPRSSRDRSYIVLKEVEKPLHFREIAEIVNGHEIFDGGNASPQTIHNELIKSDKFVLVGRGTYALREWGYRPGTVKDVIVRILEEEGVPLPQEEIVDRVLERRMVKRNTVLFNLRNHDVFVQKEDGSYFSS